MKKIICFLLASLLLVLPACAGGASHEGDSSSGDSSSEGSASKKGEYKIKYQEDIELTLKLNGDHSFTISGAEDSDELEPEDIKNQYGIETSESIKITEFLTMSGTYEIIGDNTIKADSDKQTMRMEI